MSSKPSEPYGATNNKRNSCDINRYWGLSSVHLLPVVLCRSIVGSRRRVLARAATRASRRRRRRLDRRRRRDARRRVVVFVDRLADGRQWPAPLVFARRRHVAFFWLFFFRRADELAPKLAFGPPVLVQSARCCCGCSNATEMSAHNEAHRESGGGEYHRFTRKSWFEIQIGRSRRVILF